MDNQERLVELHRRIAYQADEVRYKDEVLWEKLIDQAVFLKGWQPGSPLPANVNLAFLHHQGLLTADDEALLSQTATAIGPESPVEEMTIPIDPPLPLDQLEIENELELPIDGAAIMSETGALTDPAAADPKESIPPDITSLTSPTTTSEDLLMYRLRAALDLADSGNYPQALADLAQWSAESGAPDDYKNQAEIIRQKRQKALEAKVQEAEDRVKSSPGDAHRLYQEALQIDPQSASKYASRMAELRRQQTQAKLARQIQQLEQAVQSPRLSVRQAKERLLVEVDGLLANPQYAPYEDRLRTLRDNLQNYIDAILHGTGQVSTLEGLKEFDNALAYLDSLAKQGLTEVPITRVGPDGQPITERDAEGEIREEPVSTRRATLRRGRAQVRMAAARKWQQRAGRSLKEGAPDFAAQLLEKALGEEEGIGDVLETEGPGTDKLKEALQRDLERTQSQIKQRDQAVGLVNQAANEPFIEKSLPLLRQAARIYPALPALRQQLVQGQREFLFRIQSEVEASLESGQWQIAAGPTYDLEWLTKAYDQAEQAKKNLATLDVILPESVLNSQRRQLERLQNELQQELSLITQAEAVTEQPQDAGRQHDEVQRELEENQRELDTLDELLEKRRVAADLKEKVQALFDQIKTAAAKQAINAAAAAQAQRQAQIEKQRFLAELARKKEAFEEALQLRNKAVARAIFESLTEEDKQDAFGRAIEASYIGMQGDEEKASHFEAALNRGDYDLLLEMSLDGFEHKSGPAYERAGAAQVQAQLRLLLADFDRALQGGAFGQDGTSARGEVVRGAEGLLSELERLAGGLEHNPVYIQVRGELDKARSRLEQEVQANKDLLGKISDIQRSLDQKRYADAHRLLNDGAFPPDHPQANNLQGRLNREWRDDTLRKVAAAEANPAGANLADLYQAISGLRQANLVYSEDESRVCPWEVSYWRHHAEDESAGGNYAAAKTAWENILKLEPRNTAALQALEQAEQALLQKEQQTAILSINEEIRQMLQRQPRSVDQARQKTGELLVIPNGGEELAEFWDLLIETYQLEDEKRFPDALVELTELRERCARFVYPLGKVQKEWFEDNIYHAYRARLLGALIRQARQSTRDQGGRLPIQSLILWGQVLHQDPDNVQAKEAVAGQSALLKDVMRDLLAAERQLQLGSRSLDVALAEARMVREQLEGLGQVLTAQGEQGEARMVKEGLIRLGERERRWQKMVQAVTDGMKALRQAVTDSAQFDLTLADARRQLEEAQESNPDDGEPAVLTSFSDVFRQVNQSCTIINKNIQLLQRSFNQEQFDEALNCMREIGEALRDLQGVLQTSAEIELPGRLLYVQDTYGVPQSRAGLYSRGRLEERENIESEIDKRLQNCAEWQRWADSTSVLVKDCIDLAEKGWRLAGSGPLKDWDSLGAENAQDILNQLPAKYPVLERQQQRLQGAGPLRFLSVQSQQVVRQMFIDRLRENEQSVFFYNRRSLAEQFDRLVQNDRLLSRPAEMQAALAEFLGHMVRELADFHQELNQSVAQKIAEIEKLDRQIDRYRRHFYPGQMQAVSQMVLKELAQQVRRIKSLDRSYKIRPEGLEAKLLESGS